MSWFLIGLAAIAYLQIGYWYGILRRRVYSNFKQSSEFVRFVVFPGLAMGFDEGGPLQDRDISDHGYGAFMSVFWPLIAGINVPVILFTGLCIVAMTVVYALSSGPHRLVKFLTRRRTARRAAETERRRDVEVALDELTKEGL
jgi:hypothetical protein